MRTEALLEQEVAHVLRALTRSNELVCQVSLHTGLRVGDVLALKTEQLAPHFWISERKTGKRKQVGLPGPLLDALQKQAGEVWVFPSPRDPTKHRTRQAVWKDLKRAARLFRLPQNVGPHSLRKTYAQELLAKYGSVKRVQRALNHSNDAVTLVYLIAARELEKRHLRPALPGRR
jgi:integrase